MTPGGRNGTLNLSSVLSFIAIKWETKCLLCVSAYKRNNRFFQYEGNVFGKAQKTINA